MSQPEPTPSTTHHATIAQRDRAVCRVLWVVLACNLALAALKLWVSRETGTVTLFADAVHALLDGSSNIVGLIGVAAARRPPDSEHPYGHRRFETLAAMGVGLSICAGLVGVLHGVLRSVDGSGRASSIRWISALLVAATVPVGVAITRYERRESLRWDSALLRAEASHSLSDLLGTLAVLVALAGVALGLRFVDLAAALVVAVLIARTAYHVLSDALGVLADRAPLAPAAVREVVLSVAGVAGTHKIRSRGAIDHAHVDLHIHVDPNMTVQASHSLTHRVAEKIIAAFPGVDDVVIHTEPADGREAASDMALHPDSRS